MKRANLLILFVQYSDYVTVDSHFYQYACEANCWNGPFGVVNVGLFCFSYAAVHQSSSRIQAVVSQADDHDFHSTSKK